MSEAVAVVGSGPAADTIVSTLSEYEGDRPSIIDATVPGLTVDHLDSPAFEAVDLGVVVGRVGDAVFETANESALETDTPWIAAEIGGIGGYPVTEAAVTGFDTDGACYDCLVNRVEANVDPDAEPIGASGPAAQRVVGALVSEAAVTVVSGDDGSVFGRVLERPSAERALLPVPGCACREPRDVHLRRDHASVGVEDALANAQQGLDERLGIVQQIGEAESFPAPYYLAQLCNTAGFSDVSAPRQAAGVATDWDAAFMKALGESFERYAAGVYTESETRTAAASALDASVAPSAFVTPGESSWDETTELDWVTATDLDTGERTNVPASLVFHPPRNHDLRPPVTTGLGLGSSGVDALLSGLYEVIERDASMIAWYSSYEPLALAVDDERFESLAARAASVGLEVETLLLTQDIDVPVVAVAVHREEWPKFAVGSAAHLNPHRAAIGALEEALQNWMELRSMGPEDGADAGGAIGEYADFPEPARDLVDVDQTVPAASVGPETLPEGPAHLDVLVERVTDVGASVYGTRTTTGDLELLDFEAVRVLVPAAQPLFLGESFFGERARTVPPTLGFEPRPDRPYHPFP